jgi:hypothetical protein
MAKRETSALAAAAAGCLAGMAACTIVAACLGGMFLFANTAWRPSTPATATPGVQLLEIAAGKPAMASGFWKYAPGYSFPANGITDRRTTELPCAKGIEAGNTYWLLPDRQTGWVQIDLQQVYAIVKLRWLNTHNGNCFDRATTRFHIAVSHAADFAGEEHVIYAGVLPFSDVPEYQHYTLPEPLPARYVRFYVDDYYDWGGGLNELEVYTQVAAP